MNYLRPVEKNTIHMVKQGTDDWKNLRRDFPRVGPTATAIPLTPKTLKPASNIPKVAAEYALAYFAQEEEQLNDSYGMQKTYAMKMGNLLEESIVEEVARLLGVPYQEPPGLITRYVEMGGLVYPFSASPDFLAYDQEGNIVDAFEVKTMGISKLAHFMVQEFHNSAPLSEYYLQTQAQMLIFGLSRMWFVCYCHETGTLYKKRITRDQVFADKFFEALFLLNKEFDSAHVRIIKLFDKGHASYLDIDPFELEYFSKKEDDEMPV